MESPTSALRWLESRYLEKERLALDSLERIRADLAHVIQIWKEIMDV